MTGDALRVAKIKQRAVRRSFAIRAYNGTNGGGKTMCAVFDALPALAVGRPIVSTCRILDPATGEPHPMWVPLDDFRLLLELEYCDVILDEVTGVASSRDSAGMPSSVLNHLQQLRKGDVSVAWTTPNWRRADTAIREVTQGLTTCQGMVKSTQTVVNDDGLERVWMQRKAALWRTYDAKNFDEWSTAKERSTSKQHRLRSVARQVVWGPWTRARDFYDTYEHALTLGVVSDAGLCLDCGAKRRARTCACPSNHDGPDLTLLPDLLDSGECSACQRKRKTTTCDCQPEVVSSPSVGMLRWREVHEARKRPRLVEIPETDDTPGVVVEVPGDDDDDTLMGVLAGAGATR